MAQPTPSDVHIDAALTDLSIAQIQSESNFIAGSAFPTKPVTHKTNKFHVFVANDWQRDDAVVRRAPGEGAPRAGFTLSSSTYDCEPWWTACPMDDLARANADPAVPLDEACQRIVTMRMLIRRERLFSTAFMATSIWGTDKTPSPTWDDAASDPENDIGTGIEKIMLVTGFSPNTLIVSWQVHRQLKRHPLIKDRFKYTTADSITAEMLARFFELERYFIARAMYATNVEGGTAAQSFVIGKHALLAFVDMDPGIMTPTAVTNFVWSRLTGVNDLGVAVDQFYDDDTKEDVIRGQFAFDMKVTGKDLGYFFNGAVA